MCKIREVVDIGVGKKEVVRIYRVYHGNKMRITGYSFPLPSLQSYTIVDMRNKDLYSPLLHYATLQESHKSRDRGSKERIGDI